MKKLISSEFVSKGHPDKVADYIADSILDECLKQDKNSRSAIEVMIVNGTVFIGGELTTSAYVDINKVAREAIKEVGYDDPKWGFYYKTCGIVTSINEQSLDISSGVDKSSDSGDTGAGDQGIMFGYATREKGNKNFLPYAYVLAHKLIQHVDYLRDTNEGKFLGPDYKAEVTIERDTITNEQKPVSALISCMHEDGKLDETRKVLTELVCNLIPELDEKDVVINPAGDFVTGGPVADTGLTGRKIIVDTYGGAAHHGGGAFSGKDATKVDRSGAYLARSIAKHVVWAFDALDSCEVQLGYAIGKSNPVSLNVTTEPELTTDDYDELIKRIKRAFDLTPSGIIKSYKLKEPVYKQSTNGAFFVNLPYEHMYLSKLAILEGKEINTNDTLS